MDDEVKKKEESCCSHSSAPSDGALEKYRDFLSTAMAPGKLDVVTKEIMAIALGLAVHCVSCSRIHIEKAKKMGISNEEIEEAVALAVAFAGCRALMLWNELKKELL
jgi:AhpD family alkylhydroperoxidase